MNPEFWARTEDLLDEALDLLPHERASFLETACAEAPDLRQEVETLLAAAEDGVELLPALRPAPSGELAPGTWLQEGRYRIAARIGRGGMGEVYRAHDDRLGCDVALKRLLFRDASARHAFERDPRLLARLKHPSLPTVTDNFIENGDAFFAMEYVPGRDLSTLLKERGRPFEPDTVLDWGLQLLDILTYLHTYRSPEDLSADGRHQPILHRDIKPGNLKLHPTGKLYLLDFGISRSGSLDVTRFAGPSIGLTPHYAPPEQFTADGEETPRSDLYAWGATLYTLLTGERPPKAETRAAVVAEGHADPLKPAHVLNPAVPMRFSEVLARTMALRPEDRPPSASAVRTDLVGIVAPSRASVPPSRASVPPSRAPVVPPERPASPEPVEVDEGASVPMAALIGLLLLFLAALAFVFYATWTDALPDQAIPDQAIEASADPALAARPSSETTAPEAIAPSEPTTPPEGEGRPVVEPPDDAIPDLSADTEASVSDPDAVEGDAPAGASEGEAAGASEGEAAGRAAVRRSNRPVPAAPTSVLVSFAFRDTADPLAVLTRGYIEVDGQSLDRLASQELEPGERCFQVRQEGYALVGAQVGETLTPGLRDRVCLNLSAAAEPLRIVFHMERSR